MFKAMILVSIVLCAVIVAVIGCFLMSTIRELKEAIDDLYNKSGSIEIKTDKVMISRAHNTRSDLIDDGK